MKKFLVFASLFAFLQQASGQNASLFKGLTPVSPQSASLIKSIEYPVDYSRGVVPIEIPLWTIKQGDIEIPITLNYHTSGIKVHDASGFFGLGWSLKAEPQLSRIIKGGMDEARFLPNPTVGANDNNYLDALHAGVYDEDPDDFYFSTLGRSGNFYFSKKPGVSGYTIKTLPYQPIQVKYVEGGYDFKITDDKGFKYYYGGSGYSEIDNLYDVSAWKARKIVNANSTDSVEFSYQAYGESFYYKTLPTHSYKVIDSSSLSGDVGFTSESFVNCNGSPFTVPNVMFQRPLVIKSVNGTDQRYSYLDPNNPIAIGAGYGSYNGPAASSMTGLYIQTITFAEGRVVFEKSTVPGSQLFTPCISRVLVYNAKNELLRQISFTYLEDIAYGINNDKQARIVLQSISIQDAEITNPARYSFEYDGTHLPYFLSNAIDHWGYYNGVTSNTNLIAPQTIHLSASGPSYTYLSTNFTFGDANRSSSQSNAQARILKRIIYPTGGSISFTYELNKAWIETDNTIRDVGGLRILAINEESESANHIRTFTYGVSANGGGYLKNWIYGGANNPFIIEDTRVEQSPNFYYSSQGCYEMSYGNYYNPVTYRQRTISSRPFFDITIKGSSVVYPEVTEYSNFGNSGKTVYKYQVASAGNNPFSTPFYINGTTVSSDNQYSSWAFGHLKEKAVYKTVSPEVYSLIEKTSYQYYPEMSPDKIWTRKFYNNIVAIGDKFQFDGLRYAEQYTPYYIEYETGFMKLSGDTVKTYNNSGAYTEKINAYVFTNPVLTQPTESILTTSGGATKKTKIYFPDDMIALGQTNPYQDMKTRNMVSYPIKEEIYVNNVFKESKTTSYAKNWTVNSNFILPSSIMTKNGSDTEQERIKFVDYDNYGNLKEILAEGAATKAFIWNIGGHNLLAEVTNGTRSSVAYSGFDTRIENQPQFTNADWRTPFTSNQGLYNSWFVSESLNGGTCFKGPSLTSKTLPAGDYVLSFFAKGAGDLTINGTAKSVTGNWTYYSITLSNQTSVVINNPNQILIEDLRLVPNYSKIQTYSYKELTGMSSATDEKGEITYYEYDGFQRLKSIKDQNGKIVKSYDYHYRPQN